MAPKTKDKNISGDKCIGCWLYIAIGYITNCLIVIINIISYSFCRIQKSRSNLAGWFWLGSHETVVTLLVEGGLLKA